MRKKKVSKDEKKLLEATKSYSIKEASIKDDFCNYTFEITDGIGVGDTHNVKGSGRVEIDMNDAFAKLNVHLAVIDDVFKHSGIDIEDIDKYHNDELASLYNVSGIKIKGGRENESVILIGSKYISSAGGRIELASPKIPLDNLSSYKWYNELKAATDDVRREVELYKEGKYIPVEVEEEGDSRQMTIGDAIGDNEDFENGKM